MQVAAMSVHRGRLTLDCRQVLLVEGIQRGLNSKAMGL